MALMVKSVLCETPLELIRCDIFSGPTRLVHLAESRVSVSRIRGFV